MQQFRINPGRVYSQLGEQANKVGLWAANPESLSAEREEMRAGSLLIGVIAVQWRLPLIAPLFSLQQFPQHAAKLWSLAFQLANCPARLCPFC